MPVLCDASRPRLNQVGCQFLRIILWLSVPTSCLGQLGGAQPFSQLSQVGSVNSPNLDPQVSPTMASFASTMTRLQPELRPEGARQLRWWKEKIKSRQRSTPQAVGITLNSVIVGALQHSARVQVLSDEPLISETEITTADSAFDWLAYMDSRWDDISEPVGSTLTTGGPDRLRDNIVSFEAGLRRKNVYGGEVEIGQQFGHQNSNSLFFVPQDQGTSRLTLNYTQPLLRNAGKAYNTSLTVLAKLKTQTAGNEFERQLQEHLLEVTRAYWTLYFERGRLLQQQRLLDRGVKIQEELRSRSEIDALQSQIVRADAAVASRKSDLVRSRLAIRTAEARLRALVNDPTLMSTMTAELIPTEDLSDSMYAVDLESSIAEALQNRPELDSALQEIKAASVRMAMSKKETLPLLNMVLETYVAGLEGRSRVGRAYIEQFSEGEPSYSVGLQYEKPIWNRAASSKLQKRRLELRRMQNQFRAVMQNVSMEVEVAVHELNAAYEAIDAKSHALAAARREVDYLFDRWSLLAIDQGSASLLLEDLLDAQERLTSAELELLQSSLEFSLAQVAHKRSTGSLLTHNQVSADRSCECNMPRQNLSQAAWPPYEGEVSMNVEPSLSVVHPPIPRSVRHGKVARPSSSPAIELPRRPFPPLPTHRRKLMQLGRLNGLGDQ